MPAALNEPVNLLQRLCEELEYSELLDTANNTPDPYQRMVKRFKNTSQLSEDMNIIDIKGLHICFLAGLHRCLCNLWLLHGDVQKPLQAL